jgi:tetratricopeptide (TPR) repeat protein
VLVSISTRLTTALLVIGCAALSGTPHAAAQASDQPAAARAEAYHQFMLGRWLNGQSETEAAIVAYRRAAELDPTSAEILGELAELFAQQGRIQEAIATAESALAIDPDSIQGNWVLGNIYAAFAEQPGADPTPVRTESSARRAIDHLERARQPLVFNPGLELRLGSLYLQVEDYAAALETLEALADQAPDAREVLLRLAEAYVGVDRVDDAIVTLEDLVEREPFSRGFSRLAILYESQDRWADAVTAYERAIEQRPDSRTLKFRLARALLNDGRIAAARDQLQLLLDEDDADPAILYLMARTELQLGNFQAGETAARRLRELEPDDLRGVYALAEVFQRQREPQRLIDVVAPVVDAMRTRDPRDPELADLLVRLGFAELDLGRADRAIGAFEEAHSLAPDDPGLEAYLGQAYLDAGRFAEALDAVQAGRAHFPDDLRLAGLEARALQATGDSAAGVTLLSTLVDEHPDNPALPLALAALHVEGERFDAATRVLQSAAEAFPDEPVVFYQLGAALEQQQQDEEAEQAFLRVLALDPSHAPALNYLGYMLAERGERLETSVQYIQRALEQDPTNGAYLDSLGWALYKLNRLDEAESNLQRASRQLLTNSVIQDHLGQVLFQLGRYEEAVVAWQRALNGDGDSIDPTEIEANIDRARERAGQTPR